MTYVCVDVCRQACRRHRQFRVMRRRRPFTSPFFFSLSLSWARCWWWWEAHRKCLCWHVPLVHVFFPLCRLPAYVCVMRSYLVYTSRHFLKCVMMTMMNDVDDVKRKTRLTDFDALVSRRPPGPERLFLLLFLFSCVCVWKVNTRQNEKEISPPPPPVPVPLRKCFHVVFAHFFGVCCPPNEDGRNDEFQLSPYGTFTVR